MKVRAIFDIGKTNKKFFLLDLDHREVFRAYEQFDEVKDDDGDLCDDLPSIEAWIRATIDKIVGHPAYEVAEINFSTYGATMVHLDQAGRPLTPLYNYLKPYPGDLLASFYDRYGGELAMAAETSSPPLEMLNAGLQLYWLKHRKPEIFKEVKWSLHFPQYLSFLFSGVPLSEYTSVGCHTALWDFVKRDYHAWVYAEEIDSILPPLVPTRTATTTTIGGREVRVGVGIHDSSAALLPYLRASSDPFVLLSTGTWSIALNPFNHEALTSEDLLADCLHFLRTDGRAVKAARLFLGEEYRLQTELLNGHFRKTDRYHQQVAFDQALFMRLRGAGHTQFKKLVLPTTGKAPTHTDLTAFSSYEEALHQLMLELVRLQVASIQRILGNTNVKKIYIDGGFADNRLFTEILSRRLPEYEIVTSEAALGSALGAALVLAEPRAGY